MKDFELEAEKYAQTQCEDMYNDIGLTGAEWGWETKKDFIAGATSNAAKEYWYKEFEKEKLEFAIKQLYFAYNKEKSEDNYILSIIQSLEQKLQEL